MMLKCSITFYIKTVCIIFRFQGLAILCRSGILAYMRQKVDAAQYIGFVTEVRMEM
jgi:hypothetical protein